jgi:hypothetical protein
MALSRPIFGKHPFTVCLKRCISTTSRLKPRVVVARGPFEGLNVKVYIPRVGVICIAVVDNPMDVCSNAGYTICDTGNDRRAEDIQGVHVIEEPSFVLPCEL